MKRSIFHFQQVLLLLTIHHALLEPLFAFHVPITGQKRLGPSFAAAKKGMGGSAAGGGFGAPTQSKKKPSKKQVAKKLEKTYGGTTPQEIAVGTQKRMNNFMGQLPPHLQRGLQIYQELQKWNARQSRLSVLQLAQIPESELEGAKRAQTELENFQAEFNITHDDLHNLLQQMAWDASADAKAARALTGQMPKDIAEKIDKACAIVADVVGDQGRCLDVGCGFGVLVPQLLKAGLSSKQIVGVDLSPEMIRNAQEQHPGIEFHAADFSKYQDDDEPFDAVIFCSALHDFPDMDAALEKAVSLLRPNHGKLILVHAQGASHVLKQSSSNPILVKRGLPDTAELSSMSEKCGLTLLVEPAAAGSKQESENGYLAVLQKVS